MTEKDRKQGYYWQLPDGEQQNRCPRHHIKDDPEWWGEMIGTYNAFESGFLPHSGGMDNQPALLMPIMAIISSALEDERELKRSITAGARDKAEEAGGKQGTVSLLHGPKR